MTAAVITAKLDRVEEGTRVRGEKMLRKCKKPKLLVTASLFSVSIKYKVAFGGSKLS